MDIKPTPVVEAAIAKHGDELVALLRNPEIGSDRISDGLFVLGTRCSASQIKLWRARNGIRKVSRVSM